MEIEADLLLTNDYRLPSRSAQFFCQLHHPEVENLLEDVIERPQFKSQNSSSDGPVLKALIEFRRSSSAPIGDLLSVCSQTLSTSRVSQTVVAVIHLFNFTGAPNWQHGARLLKAAIAFRSAKALEIVLLLSFTNHPLFVKERDRLWEKFQASIDGFNSIIVRFFNAMHDSGTCEVRYAAIRNVIDSSWLMTDGRLAEIETSAKGLELATATYYMMAFEGNVEAMWNLHVLLKDAKNQSLNLLKLLAHESAFNTLEFNAGATDADPVLQDLDKKNARAALKSIWRKRSSLEESMRNLDNLERMQPELRTAVRILRWITRIYHLGTYIRRFLTNPREVMRTVRGVAEAVLAIIIVFVLGVLISIRLALSRD